jgi:hypothetical protein
MYQGGSPDRIKAIEKALQVLQLSNDGWDMADALLASATEQVRFFGALTYQVKINTDLNIEEFVFKVSLPSSRVENTDSMAVPKLKNPPVKGSKPFLLS